jgi:hypothetical protein
MKLLPLEARDPAVVVVRGGEAIVDRGELLIGEQGRRGHRDGRHDHQDPPNAHDRFTYFVNFYASSTMLRMWLELARGTARLRRATNGSGI